MVTSTDIINRAIDLIGDNQPPVTGLYPNFDSSAAGQAGNALYGAVVQTVLRKYPADFSRAVATLALTGNPAPMGWALEYRYPVDAVEIRQMIPTVIPDPNDPLPDNFDVGNTTVAGAPTKVIWANTAAAKVVYTNNPPESLWDSLFTEEVVRLLASELATAVAGRPDTGQMMLETAGAFGQIATTRQG